jgi:hypothetical protein
MARFPARQAQRTGFLIDFVADFRGRAIRPFMARCRGAAQLYDTTPWGLLLVPTQRFTLQAGRDKNAGMLHRVTQIDRAAKGTFGAGDSCAIV